MGRDDERRGCDAHTSRTLAHRHPRRGRRRRLLSACHIRVHQAHSDPWIQHLADTARAETLLRTDLEHTETDDDARDAELVAALRTLATEHSPTRYLADFRTGTTSARHVPHIPAFGPIPAVVAVTEFEPVITLDDESVAVYGGGKKLTFARRTHPALKTLLSGHPVDLGSADDAERRLAHHLIEEGLCAPLNDALSSGYTGLVTTATF